MIWMISAQTNKVVSNFIGHENHVMAALFTKFDGGK
jgi:hypothetical protein